MNIQELISQLQDSDKVKRITAAEKLGESLSAEAIEPLILSLDDKDSEVRYAVLKSISKFEDERIPSVFMKALKDKTWYVRCEAAIELEQILNENSPSVLEFLYVNDPEKLSKLSTAFALVNLNRDGEKKYQKFILSQLSDEDKSIRIHAAMMLGDLKEPGILGQVQKVFQEQDDEAQSAIILSMSNYHTSDVEDWLLDLLKHRKSSVRSTVAKVLEGFDSDKVVSQLIEALNDEHKDVRSSSAITLGNLQKEEAIQALIEKLKDPNDDVVYYSKEALGKIGI